jgi:aldose 1-epimerase
VTLQIHTIEHGDTRVGVAVGAGGRLATVDVGGTSLLAPLPAEPDPAATGWGSFPMAPWAGRIRHGRFRFLGADVRLELNHQDGGGNDPARRHAIHGTVFHRSWDVTAASADTLQIATPLAGALGWPYGGLARQRFTVGANRVDCELSVEATDGAFPGEIGWHPWFPKPRRLRFSPVAMYRRDEEIAVATGELIPPEPPPWDDCFVNTAPVTLVYDREVAPELTVSSDCDHWVVYDEPATTTCVEPQSGPPDSPNIRPRLVIPGEPLTRTMTLTW